MLKRIKLLSVTCDEYRKRLSFVFKVLYSLEFVHKLIVPVHSINLSYLVFSLHTGHLRSLICTYVTQILGHFVLSLCQCLRNNDTGKPQSEQAASNDQGMGTW